MEKLPFIKKDFLGFIVLAIVVVAIWLLVDQLDILDRIRSLSRREINSLGILAPLIFILAYISLIVALVPSAPLNIAAGILFGPTLGTLYSWLGVLLGGAISFLLARRFGEGFVSRIIKERSDILHRYNQKIENGGFATVFLFRIIPFFPIGGFNYLFGLTKLSFKNYVYASAIGIIPGVFILSFLGNTILNPNLWNFIITGTLFLVVGLSSWIYKKKFQSANDADITDKHE